MRVPEKENTLTWTDVDITRPSRSRTILESELPPHRSRNQRSIGGHPREVRKTVTHSEGKDADS